MLSSFNFSSVAHLLLNTSKGENPHHEDFMLNFRIRKCTQSIYSIYGRCKNRYKCFNFHHPYERRRPSVRNPDGSSNYSSDTYCQLYDEKTGICSIGDSCPHFHGDIERQYHVDVFKTLPCEYELNENGFCESNGRICPHAHGPEDMRERFFTTAVGDLAQHKLGAHERSNYGFLQKGAVLHKRLLRSQLQRIMGPPCGDVPVEVISQNAELTLVKAWMDYAEEIEADMRTLIPFIDDLEDSFNSHDKTILLKRSVFQIYLHRRIRALNPYKLLLPYGRVIEMITDRKEKVEKASEAVGLGLKDVCGGDILIRVFPPVQVEGRVMDCPKIVFGDKKRAVLPTNCRVPTDFEKIAVASSRFHQAKVVMKWELRYLVGEDKGKMQLFENSLLDGLNARGMGRAEPEITIFKRSELEEVFKLASGKKRSLLFIVIQSREYLHQNTKVLEHKYDVLTQEVRAETAFTFGHQAHQNVINKINTKLAGLNYKLENFFIPPGVLIMGLETAQVSNTAMSVTFLLFLLLAPLLVTSRYFFPLLPGHRIFRGPFIRNITHAPQHDEYLDELYDNLLFSERIEHGNLEGACLTFSLIVKKEPLQIFIHNEDNYRTVPLLVYFKPKDQVQNFPSLLIIATD
ncbi:hypothetical protein CAEBREN_02294 [Caenorhabditis brenneri]|uniref:C3H1-type domain-containing protein n=1 Tax=Caenorhabditis brenneri TaxID=135651 RepID=G0NYP7_CAEBE|nr:hypothetical protein CAEBREN_02294 [Caenorhabditis brenneri]